MEESSSSLRDSWRIVFELSRFNRLQGKLKEAEPLAKRALAMSTQLGETDRGCVTKRKARTPKRSRFRSWERRLPGGFKYDVIIWRFSLSASWKLAPRVIQTTLSAYWRISQNRAKIYK